MSKRLNALFHRCLQRLQGLLADIGAQGIANVLWSSATLSINPDDDVPGLVHALTSKFMYFIGMDEEKRRPTAQATANVLWAFATMGHPAATAQVVDAVCLHFGRLVDSPTAQPRPTAQAVAKLVWALGTLEHTPSDDRLLDQLCAYMRDLLCSRDRRTHPNAQEIANTVWGLGQLKHAPSQDVVTAMLEYLVASCHSPGLKPNSQDICNCFMACAELGLEMEPSCVESLLKHFMEMHISDVRQACCNLVWSLAVMQCLDLKTFDALLHKLITKLVLASQELSPQSTSAQLTTAGARQLYQAMAWLRPPLGSKQMKAWSSLQSRLLTVALEPSAETVFVPGQSVMWAALAVQEVPYIAQVQCGVYRAHALLSPHNKGVAKVILMVQRPDDHLSNLRSRYVSKGYVHTDMLKGCLQMVSLSCVVSV